MSKQNKTVPHLVPSALSYSTVSPFLLVPVNVAGFPDLSADHSVTFGARVFSVFKCENKSLIWSAGAFQNFQIIIIIKDYSPFSGANSIKVEWTPDKSGTHSTLSENGRSSSPDQRERRHGTVYTALLYLMVQFTIGLYIMTECTNWEINKQKYEQYCGDTRIQLVGL